MGFRWSAWTVLAAPLGSAITYQGQLKIYGVPLDGTVAMTFQLFDAPTIGASVSSPLSFPAVSVVDGLFTVDLDFGAAPFASDARYLQVGVNAVPLSPRQRMGPTPFALRALSASNGHALDAADGSPTNALVVNNSGFVGIGTTGPGVPLDMVGSSQSMLSLSGSHFGGTWLNLSNTSPGGKGWNLITTGPENGEGTGHLLFRNGTDGFVVMTLTYDGKTYLRNELVVDQGNSNTGTVADGLRFGFASGEAIASKRNAGGNQYGLDFYTSALPRVSITNSGNVGTGTTSPEAKLEVNGRTRTDSLEIVGGADLAEPFEIRSHEATEPPSHEGEGNEATRQQSNEVEPGTVVVIDPEHPGELRISTEPCDPKVAGIVSGAKGLAPGMVLRSEKHVEADGKHLVAMTGRVWCKGDTSSGPIRPGDLLTTSGTPGHAMRVGADADIPRGAILGKAMSELTGGTGLVLVLVNLQ